MAHTIPEGSTCYRVEVLINGGWAKCRGPDGGAHFPATNDPEQVASDFWGPGRYRVIWHGDDHRRRFGVTGPFVIEGQPVPIQASAPALQPTAATAPVEQPPQPVTSAQPVGTTSSTMPALPPPQPMVAPTFRPATHGAAVSIPPEMMQLPELRHLAVFTQLYQLVQLSSREQLERERMFLMTVMETERERNGAAIALERERRASDVDRERAHAAELERSRRSTEPQTALATTRPAELDALTAQVEDLSMRLSAVSTSTDDGEDEEASRERFERFVGGVAAVVGKLAESPIGQALAQKLAGAVAPA